MNPSEQSYKRLGVNKAPKYISWSSENRSQLVRIPASPTGNRRAELRSPDPSVNPYIAYALIIYAGLEGLDRQAALPFVADFDMFHAGEELKDYQKLPESLKQAQELAKQSDFVHTYIPQNIIDAYCAQ